MAHAQTASDDAFSSLDLVPTRLREAVLERLISAILDGRLKPGDALPAEARLAMSFGVSKQIAREAIRELAAMGVVEIRQGKVTRVRQINAEPLSRFFSFAVRGSREGMNEAVEMRRLLEPPIAALAAQRRSDRDVEGLKAVLARMAAAIEDPRAWIEADLDFHESLAAMCGNRLLRLQMLGLRPVIQEIMEAFSASRARSRADWEATLRRHEPIVDAIAAGDPAAALAAMNLHFEAADRAIGEIFPARTADG